MQSGSTIRRLRVQTDCIGKISMWPASRRHFNTNHRFTIRGYQTFTLDRKRRHKGVLILVRNSIAACDFKVDTNQQAEIHGVNMTSSTYTAYRLEHPWSNPRYLLTVREQETVFRLRTGHSRLSHHLYSELRIGHTEQCPCGTGDQTTEHLLQSCPLYEPLRESGQTTLP